MISAIALDLGSTSIKAGLLDEHGTLAHIVALPAPPVRSDGGRYESDALAYALAADLALKQCLEKMPQDPINYFPPLGLCSQRSSFVIWDSTTGQPVTPLISWQDNRGAESCTALQSLESLITSLSGLRLTPYFFAAKLRVVLLENPQWMEKLQRRDLLVGTLDTFLIWRWTAGKHHITDVSMAARTLLMGIREQQWSPALCEMFGLSPGILPTINPSTGLNIALNNGLKLQASLADQSAALVASVGEDRDVALVNLGTGGFVIRYLDVAEPVTDGYLRTLVYQEQDAPTHIAIEGTLNSIASALAPYPVSECKFEDMAAQQTIYSLAEPSGLGAPYFRNDLGLEFSSSVEHLSPREVACLLLEAIIFRVVRILEEFDRFAPIKRVFLSGGLSELACLQEGIATCLNQDGKACAVYRLQQRDTSLQGAAILASGLKQSRHQDLQEVVASHSSQALHNKYISWKLWVDELVKA